MLPGWCCIANRHIGARERRQLVPPHVRFQVPFLGPESQLKSGFACAGSSVRLYELQAGSSATMQKVPQASKPTWVSVQDVVLNSLRPSTQPSQLLPELSHFYQTHKHKERCLAHVAMVLIGVSRLDTK